MREDKIVMSQKQLNRFNLLQLVLDGRISLRKATPGLGVSYRHAKRLKAAFARDGPAALVHGNTGRPPDNALDPLTKERIRRLITDKYEKFNDTHCTEKLILLEKINVSRETVRKMRRAASIAPKRKRRPPKHRKQRPRRSQKGLMLLWDGSQHRWFGEEHPPCCLIACLDDADSELLYAHFIPTETTYGYFTALKQIVQTHGIPMSVYHDRNSIFTRNDNHWSLEEQLQGFQNPTQLGAALKDLGIESIASYSPQARGRIERLFGTLQDRLIAEMQLENITTIEQANPFLITFSPQYNERFAKIPENTEKAFRRCNRNLDLDRITSFRYQATVANDNCIRLRGITIQIPPGTNNRSWAKTKVHVHQLLDGSWRIYYKDQLIATEEPTPVKEPKKARRANHQNKGGPKEILYYPLPEEKLNQGTFSLCT